MTDDKAIEREVREKGLTAPRITPDDLEAKIAREMYYVFPDTTLTVCCLVLENGFCVTGESACASPENFNAEVGRKIARAEAKDKIWSLEGYLLRQKLHEAAEFPVRPGQEVTVANPLRVTLRNPVIPGAAGGVTTIIVGSM